MFRPRVPPIVAACLASVVSTCETRSEAADRVVVRLEYDRAPAVVDVCPAESSFRNLVVARLGYDAFAADDGEPRDAVRITLGLKQGRVQAAASLLRAGQPRHAPRALEGPPGECDALVAALATTVAIALDPVHAASPVPVATAQAPAQAAPKDATPSSPPPVDLAPVALSSHPDSLLLFASAAPVVSGWIMPSVSLGAEAGVGLRLGRLSVEVLGRAEAMPAPVRGKTADHLTASLFTAAVVPCGAVAGARLCGVFRAGELEGEDVDLSRSGSQSLYATVGLRGGYSFRLSDAFRLEPSLEGDVPLTQTTLTINGGKILLWTAPVASLSFALSAFASF